MGVLFDLVIAEEGTAEEIGRTERLFEDFRVFPTKMLDPVTVDGLFSLLDPASSDIESWWQAPLYETEDVLWVYQWPPCFVERLANLVESERNDLAQRWSQTEEVQNFYRGFSDLSPSDVASDVGNFVNDLCLFASEAVEGRKCIFLRIIL